MKTIYRFNSFETNSSSTHSLILCSLEDYEKLKKGELLIDENDDLIDAKEISSEKDILRNFKYTLELFAQTGDSVLLNILKDLNFDSYDEFIQSIIANYDYKEYKTLDEWCNNDYLEIEEYKDKKLGVVAIAKYGYDG